MFCKLFPRKLAGVIFILSIGACSTSVRYQDVPCKDVRVWKQERFFPCIFERFFYVLSVIVFPKFPSSSTAV